MVLDPMPTSMSTCRFMDTVFSKMGNKPNCCTLKRALMPMCQAEVSPMADLCSSSGMLQPPPLGSLSDKGQSRGWSMVSLKSCVDLDTIGTHSLSRLVEGESNPVFHLCCAQHSQKSERLVVSLTLHVALLKCVAWPTC